MDCRGLSREEVLRNKQKRVQTTLFFFFYKLLLKSLEKDKEVGQYISMKIADAISFVMAKIE